MRQESWINGLDVMRSKFPECVILLHWVKLLGRMHPIIGRRPWEGCRHRFNARIAMLRLSKLLTEWKSLLLALFRFSTTLSPADIPLLMYLRVTWRMCRDCWHRVWKWITGARCLIALRPRLKTRGWVVTSARTEEGPLPKLEVSILTTAEGSVPSMVSTIRVKRVVVLLGKLLWAITATMVRCSPTRMMVLVMRRDLLGLSGLGPVAWAV